MNREYNKAWGKEEIRGDMTREGELGGRSNTTDVKRNKRD